MKKFLIMTMLAVGVSVGFYSFQSRILDVQNERDDYYKNTIDKMRVDTRCMQSCIKDDCDGEGGICAACSYSGCGPKSKCTCLDYGAPYVQEIANCLGIPQLTPQIWAGLSQSQRNMPCVVAALEPHLIPDH